LVDLAIALPFTFETGFTNLSSWRSRPTLEAGDLLPNYRARRALVERVAIRDRRRSV